MNNAEKLPLRLLRISGGWWQVPGVKEQPAVELTQWQVFRLPDGELHFVGWQEVDLQGRVSSAVMEFNAALRCGRTKSGRLYRLEGAFGCNGDAGYAWRTWMRLNREDSCEEVSAQFEAMMSEHSA